MQISNNYQPNFKSGEITKNANELLSKRMKSGEFIALQDEFKKKFADSKFEILIDTINENSTRLYAMIAFNDSNRDPKFDKFFRYIEQGFWESIFTNPKKFFKKVYEEYQNAAVPFEKNGFKKIG